MYASLRDEATLECRFAGDPAPSVVKWFFNGREEPVWSRRQTAAAGEADLRVRAADARDSDANYTCFVDNGVAGDSVTYRLKVQGGSRRQA